MLYHSTYSTALVVLDIHFTLIYFKHAWNVATFSRLIEVEHLAILIRWGTDRDSQVLVFKEYKRRKVGQVRKLFRNAAWNNARHKFESTKISKNRMRRIYAETYKSYRQGPCGTV